MFEIGKFYGIDEFNPEWLQFFRFGFYRFHVPTETLVYEPQLTSPGQARAYRTDLYLYEGNVVEYEFLRTIPDFHGTRDYDSVVMSEVWEDRGSDGHVHYELIGFRFVSDKDLKKMMTYWKGDTGLPVCMTRNND